MSTTSKPRIAGWEWQKARPDAIAIYNAGYSPSGHRIWHGEKPWTVIGPATYETFPTHREAVAYAFREVGK